ncbi:MAG TPA: DUF6519 domain-containing protein [Candidatus Kapabacteria bacterium]|nr:DUF6519 domain-containing protein [Candidatus Kapabacteria bacterium]
MQGDFTRSTFDPKKHYSGVRMQQGRVQLDADWNEQVDIDTHRDQTTTADVIGPSGVPVLPDGTANGFKIMLPGFAAAETNMQIGAGRIYVDGVLCENEETVFLSTPTSPFTGNRQPDYDDPSHSNGYHIVYLDVWERHINAIEDPSIREVALGGPDTATRTKTVWQVKTLPITSHGSGPLHCTDEFAEWDVATAPSSGRLTARTEPAPSSDGIDPCIIPPNAGYRGLENQLYRVEIHRVDTDGTVTYKWSRDNASFQYGLVEFDANTGVGDPTLTVTSLGRDQNSSLEVNDWIEFLPATWELGGIPGILAKITAISTTDKRLTLLIPGSEGDASDVDGAIGAGYIVKRWDFVATVPPTTKINVGDTPAWIPIENGVEIRFEPGLGGTYKDAFHVGDYWMIPARVATQDIEWPLDSMNQSIALAPMGIRHRYARLALAQWTDDGWDRVTLKDCRPTFLPLTGVPTLVFGYAGGDGQEAAPGDALPMYLEASVVERGKKVIGANVKFTVKLGNGKLRKLDAGVLDTVYGQSVIAPTSINGVAQCEFTLDLVTEIQQVEAVLLDDDGLVRPLNVIHYNATFSDAGSSFTYVGGDGQEGLPGDYLRMPLEVGVNRNGKAVGGARVRYTVTRGNGSLQATQIAGTIVTLVMGPQIITQTAGDGVAKCEFLLDTFTRDQQVEARLLDDDDNTINVTPIHFDASIRSNVEFLYVGGDGQEGLPGAQLAVPFEAGVVDGAVKLQGANVQFTVIRGGGSIVPAGGGSPATQVVVQTGPDGVAGVYLTLDAITPVQQVRAVLIDGEGSPLNYTPLHFTAAQGLARDIAYTPPTGCTKFAESTTVQEALDSLCACDCAECPPILHVTGVFLGTGTPALGPEIHSGATIPVDSLLQGIRIQTDANVDSFSVKPTTVYGEVEFPYPITPSERQEYGLDTIDPGLPLDDQIIGYRPIGVRSLVSVDTYDNSVIHWDPQANAVAPLVLAYHQYLPAGTKIPVKVIVRGTQIWAEGDPARLLTGTVSPGTSNSDPASGRNCDQPGDFVFNLNVFVPTSPDPCPQITSVIFDTPIISGQPATGIIQFDKALAIGGGANMQFLTVQSDNNAVIQPTGITLVPRPLAGDTGHATTFNFSIPTESRPTADRSAPVVHLTFISVNGQDPCQRNFTSTVTVNPVPCPPVVSSTFTQSVTVGQPITGRIKFAEAYQVQRTLTITSDHADSIVPNPAPFTVPAGAQFIDVTIPTNAASPLDQRTPVVLTVNDPCAGQGGGGQGGGGSSTATTGTVYVDPIPCEHIAQFSYDPVIGGNDITLHLTFDRPLSQARTINFSSNPSVIETRSVTLTPASGQVSYNVVLHTTQVTNTTDVLIAMDPCGTVVRFPVTVSSPPCDDVVSFTVDTSVIGGQVLHGTLTLATPPAANRDIVVHVDKAYQPYINDGQVIHVTAGSSTVTQFTLNTNVVTDVSHDAVMWINPCGTVVSVGTTVTKMPCELVQDWNFPSDVYSGGTINGVSAYFSSPVVSTEPVVFSSSVPGLFPDIVIPVTAGATRVTQTVPVDVATVPADTAFDVIVTRCGREIFRIHRVIKTNVIDWPRIKAVTYFNPDAPASAYQVHVTTPGAVPQVDMRELGLATPNNRLGVKVQFCDVLPDPATLNDTNFRVLQIGSTTPVPVMTRDMVGDTAILTIGAWNLTQGGHYQLQLRGAGTGVIATSSGKPLHGAFDVVLDGTACTGTSTTGSTGSDFMTNFTLVFGPGAAG